MRKTYYVYMYCDNNHVPFYVGLGCGTRWKISGHIRQQLHLGRKIKKLGESNIVIHFLHRDITREDAEYWERYWIRVIGRRDRGLGSLLNYTDGGDGMRGRIMTEELRRKIASSLIGHKHTPETCAKMSATRTGKKITKKMIYTEERNQKIRLAMLGNKFSLGFKHTEETRRKMSEATKANWAKRRSNNG